MKFPVLIRLIWDKVLAFGGGMNTIKVSTYYAVKGSKARLCIYYDRGLCGTVKEYCGLSTDYIEEQAYGAYMDGAR